MNELIKQIQVFFNDVKNNIMKLYNEHKKNHGTSKPAASKPEAPAEKPQAPQQHTESESSDSNSEQPEQPEHKE